MAGVFAFVVTLLIVCCQNSLAMQQHQHLQPQQQQPQQLQPQQQQPQQLQPQQLQPQQLQSQQMPQVAEQLQMEYLDRLVFAWQRSQPEPGSGHFFTSETTAVVVARDGEFGCLFNDSFYPIGGSEWGIADACVELHCVIDEQSATGMPTVVQQLKHCGPAMSAECVPMTLKSETCCPMYTCPAGIKESLRLSLPSSQYDLLKFSHLAAETAGNELPQQL